MEHSLNQIKHISLQQPNETLKKLVEDYQLSNRRHTIHLDNNVSLPLPKPFPDAEQKKTHVRQKSITKKKRASLYQDYTNTLSQEVPESNRPKLKSVTSQTVSSDQFTHCRPVHTKFRSSLLKSYDIDSQIRDQLDSVAESDNVDANTSDVDQHPHQTIQIEQQNRASFVGIRNLIFLILAITHFRWGLELISSFSLSTLHYYIRVYIVYNSDIKYCIRAIFTSLVCLVCCYSIEYIAVANVSPASKLHRLLNLSKAKKSIKRKKSLTNIQLKSLVNLNKADFYSMICVILHLTVIACYITITFSMVYSSVHNCLIGTLISSHAIILAFKLISYCLTNRELRDLYIKSLNQKSISSSSSLIDPKGENGSDFLSFMPVLYNACQYPKNITATNIFKFWSFPTLIYQPVYPIAEEKKIDYAYIGYKTVEIVTATAVNIYLNNHYALPIFEKLLSLIVYDTSLSSMNRSIQVLELLLRLSTISIAMWFILYYSFFNNFLNILAEYTRFGDRSFYYNWWNSDSVAKYWARWNKPLTLFMKRHVFVAAGSNSPKTKSVVFLVCAIIAELVIGVSTHKIFGLAFLSVSLQVPLIYITEKLNPPNNSTSMSFTGNCLFWCSFFIGHPLCFLFYYLSWCAKNNYVNEYNFRR